jgi:hypothetical protein
MFFVFSIAVATASRFVSPSGLSELIFGVAMAKASEIFSGSDSDAKVKEIKHWLKTKGVRDFEPVSLFCDQLTKVGQKLLLTFHSFIYFLLGNCSRD